ncbi:hypothetical protein K432DRAFT_384527 [Lepidopterella palustris CBS 459.81]|uniref:F-box domain-containing protein n=1 Tax=Lepidopterella palustris CBS 459.81 TaxID=1314670 RepID=A0A8E2E597_9PEZI|nr:hypothetical protein K432DRAFT_384527 [Lepidopterella palustris CBS 459.81]
MGSSTLLNLPPELLLHILSFLPIQALLKFSQTSRSAHALATSSLHTLSLGIYTTRIAGVISRLGSTSLPIPQKITSVFACPPSSLETSISSIRASSSGDSTRSGSFFDSEPDLFRQSDPYRISVLIPDAQTFDYDTLLAFHNALTSSILTRHCSTLRHLDISLWTLTAPVAHALTTLPALRVLALRIDHPHARSIPRSRRVVQSANERAAWELLVSDSPWAERLQALRIEGGEVSGSQLGKLLSKNHFCREIWLGKCYRLGKEIWKFLGSEWKGRFALRVLGVMRCGGELDEEDLELVGGLCGLKVS